MYFCVLRFGFNKWHVASRLIFMFLCGQQWIAGRVSGQKARDLVFGLGSQRPSWGAQVPLREMTGSLAGGRGLFQLGQDILCVCGLPLGPVDQK